MPSKDPWKKKASKLAYRCRVKGGGAVVWTDGHPVDDTTRVRAVDVAAAPDDESLVGVYGPDVSGPEIESDLMDDLARSAHGALVWRHPHQEVTDAEDEAEDPPTDNCVSTSINSGATDTSPEPEHQEATVAEQTDHQDLPKGVDSKAINHARALLYRRWVQQHEQGKTGHRALYGWLIKKLEEVAG